MVICIAQLDTWTEKEFTYDVSYNNQTTATVETETSSDEDDIAGPTMVRELKTGLYVCVCVCACMRDVCVCAYVCVLCACMRVCIYICSKCLAHIQTVHIM